VQQLMCRCGNAYDLSAFDPEGQLAYFPAHRWNETVNTLVESVLQTGCENRELLSEALHDALVSAVKYFFRCGQCGRLIFPSKDYTERDDYVLEHPADPAASVLARETPGFGHTRDRPAVRK
jgi:hypothetical protein